MKLGTTKRTLDDRLKLLRQDERSQSASGEAFHWPFKSAFFGGGCFEHCPIGEGADSLVRLSPFTEGLPVFVFCVFHVNDCEASGMLPAKPARPGGPRRRLPYAI